DRWRESPAASAPDARRPSARATTAATATGSSSTRTGSVPRPASGTGLAAEAAALPSLRRLPPLLLVLLGHATEAGHGHEHVLETLGDLGIEGEPALDQRFRRNLFDVGHHLLLHPVHHRRLHRLHVRKAEKLPGLERRAIYLDINLHDRSSCWVLAVSPRCPCSRKDNTGPPAFSVPDM